MNDRNGNAPDNAEYGTGGKAVLKKGRIFLGIVIVALVAVALWQHLRIVRLENAVLQLLAKPDAAATAGNMEQIKRKSESLREDAMSRLPASRKGTAGAGGMSSTLIRNLPRGKTRLEGKKLERAIAQTLGCDANTADEVLEILSRETKKRHALQVELEKEYIPHDHFITEVKALRAETDRQVNTRLTNEQKERYAAMRRLKSDDT